VKQNTASLRVVAELRERIRSGELAPGKPVPSARQIVREFDVALATATKALALLRDEGLVRAVPGIGTIVRGRATAGPELSLARIVEAAISIADDEGTAALTMRSVAKELGVATMSLYRHVPHKDALVIAMADAVLGELALPRPHEHWRAQLEALARLQWDGYRRHRWLAPMLSMTRPQRLPNGMRHTDAVLAALAPFAMTDAQTLATGIAFIGMVRGMAVGLEAEREAERDTGMDQDEWMRAQEATFAPLIPKFPALAKLSGAHVDLSLDAQFDRALGLVLDGLATHD
jgi:DNA-binding transcriptional regulator YhcF (GntR family)